MEVQADRVKGPVQVQEPVPVGGSTAKASTQVQVPASNAHPNTGAVVGQCRLTYPGTSEGRVGKNLRAAKVALVRLWSAWHQN